MALNLDPHKVKLIDCSGNPNYPESTAGDAYTVSVAGKIGGSSGINVVPGAVILCVTDTLGGTLASAGAAFLLQGGGMQLLTAASTLTAAQCSNGNILAIQNATGFITTLPAPFLGMNCIVQNLLANTSGNHTLVTAGSSNIIQGTQFSGAGDAGDTGATDDTISFVANQSVAGDFVRLTSDGTKIYAQAWSRVAAGMTLTTAS
jgi:hypothetical protein